MRGRRAGSSLYVDVNIEVGFPYYGIFNSMQFVGLKMGVICVKLVNLLVSKFAWQVDPFCSVSAAHEIGENVRDQIHKSHPEVAEVFIHIGKLFYFFIIYYL